MLFKLDFAKAYTKIFWDFLGFFVWSDGSFRMARGTHGLHLVLGSEGSHALTAFHCQLFQFEKEFGKDIPYLSILVGEAFNVLVNIVVENKKIKGVMLLDKVNQHVISQYVDDTLLTIKGEERIFNSMIHLLQRFKVTFGLEINDKKKFRILTKPWRCLTIKNFEILLRFGHKTKIFPSL